MTVTVQPSEAESLLIRTEGGPRPGEKLIDLGEWPLPELLFAEGGLYVQAGGDVPTPAGEPLTIRYTWQSGDASVDQLTKAIAVAIRARRHDETCALLLQLAVRAPHLAAPICDVITLAAKPTPQAVQ